MKRLTSFLLILTVLTSIAPAANQGWQRWSEKKAKGVVKDATQVEGLSTWKTLGRIMGGGLMGGVKMPQVQVTWITDDTCWALARIRQI